MMAEAKTKRKTTKSRSTKSSSRKSGSSGSRSRNGRSSGNRSSNSRSTREVVAEAVTQLQELIGRPVESVTGVEKDGSEWTVMIEVLELERIPNTTDVLGIYDVKVDRSGELTSAKRTRRYHRAEAGDD